MTEAALWRTVARGVFLVFGLLFAVFLVQELQTVVMQLVLATIIAAAATPLVDELTISERARRARLRLARGVVAILLFLVVFLVFAIGAVLVASAVAPDLRRLAVSLPDYVRQGQDFANDVVSRVPFLAGRLEGGAADLQIQDLLTGVVGLAAQAPQVLRIATGAFGSIFNILFTLIIALYLTIDGHRVRDYLLELFPFDRQPQAERIADRIGLRLGAWARGEAVLATIVGTLTWIAALALGLPYAGALALIAGIGELVPNLGPFIAAIPLVIVGFLTSPTHGLLALGVAVLIQQLENNIIVPRVMGHAVELHPVVVMVAILAGNELLGIMGALLAVPIAASLAVVIDELQRERLARHEAEAMGVVPPSGPNTPPLPPAPPAIAEQREEQRGE